MNADGSNVQVLYDEPGVEVNHFNWGVVPATAAYVCYGVPVARPTQRD